MIQFEINFSQSESETRSSERADDTLANLRKHDIYGQCSRPMLARNILKDAFYCKRGKAG